MISLIVNERIFSILMTFMPSRSLRSIANNSGCEIEVRHWEKFLSLISYKSSRNCIWDRFSPTAKTATRLLGFVITDYPCVQRIMENGVTVTIWHPLDRTNIVISYLLDVAPKLVNMFEDYFGTQHPTNHLNIYCIPTIIPYISAKLGTILIP